VTLASIVEKETGKADERPRVAGVFINRLRKHMRLQSDPTIVYGLVAGQGALGRSLTRADIDAPSAYNTYQIDGLPPGPIANPGRAAMEAVANPSRTGELYFVADGTGGHVFADSLDVHNRNVLRWRQIEQINKAKGAPGRDDHTELEPSTDFGAPPPQAEFAARRSGALPTPTLRPDPAMIARLAPSLPGAQAPPRSLAEFSIARGAAPKVEAEDIAYADAPMGGITRAENELDGPAQEPGQAPATMPVSPRLQAEMRARAARYGGGALDGPAAPVEAGALAYANGPVNAAPNGKPRIIDASEGTALDPLLDKSWDLNSPKNVDMSTPKALLGK
jgi:UPF0755 protein